MAAPGDRLGDRYELIEIIGSGGMAIVWRARDTRLRRAVAVKILRPQFAEDADFVGRFESEARHAASLAHPNVATVYDTGSDPGPDGGTRYIVMELIDGPSVAEVLRGGPLPVGLALDIAIAAARALAAAHRRGIVHRDVKPGNLLIGPDGRVRLADFGIARALASARLTTAGTMFGSAPYMSPEQANGGEVLPPSDLYSLGVVLHEMLHGTLPPSARGSGTPDSASVDGSSTPGRSGADASDGHSIPAGLDAIVGRALQVDPAARHPSARAFADALESVARRLDDVGRRGGVQPVRAARPNGGRRANSHGPRRRRPGRRPRRGPRWPRPGRSVVGRDPRGLGHDPCRAGRPGRGGGPARRSPPATSSHGGARDRPRGVRRPRGRVASMLGRVEGGVLAETATPPPVAAAAGPSASGATVAASAATPVPSLALSSPSPLDDRGALISAHADARPDGAALAAPGPRADGNHGRRRRRRFL